jgi:hypothetical protein
MAPAPSSVLSHRRRSQSETIADGAASIHAATHGLTRQAYYAGELITEVLGVAFGLIVAAFAVLLGTLAIAWTRIIKS